MEGFEAHLASQEEQMSQIDNKFNQIFNLLLNNSGSNTRDDLAGCTQGPG